MSTQLANDTRATLLEELGLVLSSSMALALKTQGFHWNVTGANFFSLHEMFAQQYAELFAAGDEIAERIRALGAAASAGLGAYAKRSIILDAPEPAPDAQSMLRALQNDHESLSMRCAALRRLADESDDTATGDLMNGRITAHDKSAWMLRAHQI